MSAPLSTLSRRTFLALSGALTSAAAGTCALPGFAATTSTQKSTGALPTFPAAKFLDAADLSALTGDEQCLLVSLQGQVNRKQPRLYFYWGTDTTNQRWLNTIKVPHRISTDPWEFLAKYRSEIRGAVVYDINVPDTVNVATAIASTRGGVIATAALAKAHQLNVIEDLTGKFANGMAAYQWAFDNVWPHMTNRILTAISPTNSVQVANVQWTTLLQVTQPVTDGSNKAVYTADLTPFLSSSGAVYVRWQDAYSNDGWGPSVDQVTVTADGNVIAAFQPASAGEAPFAFDLDSSQTASGWRFSDGTEYFIYKFVPPAGTKKLTLSCEMWNEYLVSATGTAPSVQQGNPNFRDYIVAAQAPVFWLDPEDATQAALFTSILQRAKPDTPYLGWFPQGHEMTGVTLCGQHASPVVAADFYINGSVFAGGARAPISSRITHPPVPKIENKIYLTLTMVEGDNAQYNQHRMRDMWDDAGRGAVPLNWSISVLLYDLGPAILGYYQRTATANDLLMAGPSGAGYTYPAVWPAAALEGYTQRSGAYMQASGMDTLFAYNRNGSNDLPFTASIIDRYERNVPGLLGIVYNYESSSQVSFIDGMPLATLLGVNNLASGQTELAQVAAAWSGTAPLFVAAGLESWNMTPTDAKNLVDSLGSQFQVVRGDTFFQMLRGTQTKP
jgi:putative glycoside hydrolase with GxGYxYP motif/GxGYxY motif-containing protein